MAVGLRPRSLLAALAALALAWLPGAETETAVGLDGSLEARLGLPMVGDSAQGKKKKNDLTFSPLSQRVPNPQPPPPARAPFLRRHVHITLAPHTRVPPPPRSSVDANAVTNERRFPTLLSFCR
jgi:hypothetical protein